MRHFLEVLDELSHLNVEFVSLRENIDTGGPLVRAVVVIDEDPCPRSWVLRLGRYDSVPSGLPFCGHVIGMSFIHLYSSHAKGFVQPQDRRVRSDGPYEPTPTTVTLVTIVSACCER